jgi:hypothetical protein
VAANAYPNGHSNGHANGHPNGRTAGHGRFVSDATPEWLTTYDAKSARPSEDDPNLPF